MLKSLLSLTRYKLSLSVAFSGLVGYLYFCHHIDMLMWLVFSGIFFLSCGASALNQVQEKDHDAKMTRTRKRPIPMGLISVTTSLGVSLFLIISGLIIIFFSGSIIGISIGILSILWYNGFYTLLKRKTAYAVFPGSFTGVFPILIGWHAAGGNLLDKHLLFISFFMAMWQIPHFLLLMFHYNDDYKKADFPTFSDFLNAQQIKRLIVIWTTCTVFSSFFLIVFNIISPFIFKSLLLASGIIMLVLYLNEILHKEEMRYKLLFIAINSYMLLVMILLGANYLLI